ncbi:MAG: ComEC/Rec2 family competence protein [Thermoguttaceae bacterium]|jgi:competence protein ComEC
MSSYPEINAPNAVDRTDIPHYHPLLIVLAAASAGILADYYWPQPFATWFAAALAMLGVWCLLARSGRRRTAAVAILLAILSMAGAWHHCRWNLFDENDLGNYTAAKKQPVALEAFALGTPRPLPPSEPGFMQSLRSEPSYRMEISAVAIRDADKWKPISGRALFYIQGDVPAVEAGDRIRIFGELSAPTPAHNPGQFDRAAYLRSHRIGAQIQSQTECISMVQPGSRWNLSRWLEGVRKNAAALFERYLDPRQAELASAIFLGEREQIDSQRNEAFMATGTVHVLVISGLHVGILAGALFWAMRWTPIPRAWGLTLIALITGLYALMVDVHPPVVRATILVLVMCLSIYLKRPALSLNSLAAAALVVLAINPSDLFNIGAQLSFLAVAAIMWFWPHCFPLVPIIHDQDHLQKMAAQQMNVFSRSLWHLRRCFWELMLMGAVLWVMTQPLVAARFHILSPIALVMNIFLWLPITLGLLSGFVFLFVAAVVPPLAGASAVCCNCILWLLEKAIDFAAALPGSHYWVSGPGNWWLAGYYGGLAAWAAFPRIRPRPRWGFAVLAGWTALGLAISYARHDSNRLHCTFLSVGHGCAAVLELPSGQTLLYDAGQFGAPVRAARIISGFLWSRGITRIDAVIVSHPDIDHYNALPEVLEKCSIGVVYVSPVMFKNRSPALKELKSAFAAARVPVREICAGDRLEGGADCRLEVLHPPPGGIPGYDNANSVVLMVEYSGRRIILPGDLESPGLDRLLAKQPLHCDVLLAPHHGSRQSNSPGLAAWTRPAWVVFSGDGQWTLPEIDATYQAVGSHTLHTFLSGAVEVTIDKNGTRVETFLKQRRKNE